MASPVVSITLQAAFLSALSNLLAQAVTAYRANRRFTLKITPLAQFVIWTLISTPPNFYWQLYLEDKFPSTVLDASGVQRLSKANTAKKFILDQSIASPINNLAFLIGINSLKGRSIAQIQRVVQTDFWPLIKSGWKVWPLVSVLSFSLIPANRRILFGSVIGLFWGIYLSILAAH